MEVKTTEAVEFLPSLSDAKMMEKQKPCSDM